MTHNDPGNPRPGTRTTDTTTRPVDASAARAAERSNFTMLLGILLAALIIVPLLVWWLWAPDTPDAELPPAAQIEVAPDTDAAVAPAVDESVPGAETVPPVTDEATEAPDATPPAPETAPETNAGNGDGAGTVPDEPADTTP